MRLSSLLLLSLASALLLVASTLPLVSATTDCSLRSLKLETSLGEVALQPVFGRTVRSYKATVPYEATWVKLTAKTYASSTLLRLWYQYAQGTGTLTDVGGSVASGDTSSAISLVVGVNSVGVKVKCDCALTYVVTVTREPPIYTKGDPDFAGLLGQQFQVHGVAGEVYNVISDRSVQMNSRFVFLDQGECPVLNGRRAHACWSHPGSYLGEIGIQTSGGDRVHIASGAARQGFERVTLNGVELEMDEVMPLRAAAAGSAADAPALIATDNAFESPDGETSVVIGSGADRLIGSASSTGTPSLLGGSDSNDWWVVRNSTHLVTVRVSNFLFQIENSDHFVNYRVQVLDWAALPGTHGLLGQTYRQPERPGKQVKEIDGSVDDYRLDEADLYGTGFIYNRFGL